MPGGIVAETRRAMTNIEAILDAAGGSLADVVECSCLLQDLKEYSEFNSVYETFFNASQAPARAAFQVVQLPLSARCEVKCTAVF